MAATHPWHLGPVRSVTPEQVGWTYCGLRIVSLAAGAEMELATGSEELAVVPLAGASSTVDVEGRHFDLDGRSSVFARVTDWCYLPIDAEVHLASRDGAVLALASARAQRRFDPAYVAAGDVRVELRGAGPSTRQVNNFMSPEAFDGADKLIAVEVLTPDGNWSSYPPHKHDDSPECPANNEEIYYFRVGRTSGTDYAPEGFAMHRTYTRGDDPAEWEPVEIDIAVTDGDVFVIPRGYHGPCVAAPGYPLYYLNVMAGPGEERSMAFCDDPAHHWVRDTWATMPVDPRCPLTSWRSPATQADVGRSSAGASSLATGED
jgi:5-deoxy-glucuronate isomerase